MKTTQNLINVAAGTYTVTVKDKNGCTVSKNFTVPLLPDTQAPTISCDGAMTVSSDPGLCGAFLQPQDNEPVDFRLGGGTSGGKRDATTSSATTVTTTGRVIPLSNRILYRPITTDNCGIVNLTATRSDGLRVFADMYPVGTTRITWKVVDGSGNSNTCTQDIVIVDVENPVINLPSDLNLTTVLNGCGANVSWTEPTATDNCSISYLHLITSNVTNGGFFTSGTHTITYEAKDVNGNVSQQSFTIVVADRQIPTIITCPSAITVVASNGCTQSVSLTPPTANDNCTPGQQLTITNNAPSPFPVGTTVVTWSITDASGNTATCTQNVTVLDQKAPTPNSLILLPVVSVCSATVTPPTATDCGNTITATTTDPTTYTQQGTHTITWTYTDASGNSSTQTQTVTIADVIAPIILCPADITVSANETCGRRVTVTPATATDNCSATVTGVRADGKPLSDCYPVGTTVITWTAVDPSGNSVSCQQRVIVTGISISGKVYDDEDALTDGTIDGTLISNAGGQLYVNLVNAANNTVVASKAVTAGAFSFTTADGLMAGVATYKLVLASSATATTASLPNPAVWLNTGEGAPASAGDGTVDGTFTFGAAVVDGQKIDFGIEARPVPTPLTTAPSQLNPGGTATVAIAQTLFSATDVADLNGGEVRYLHLLTFPTNTTTANFASASTSLHGTYAAASYTAATFPAGGIYVATNLAGNPTAALSVDPINGAVTVEYTYKAIDQADAESISVGVVRQPLTDISISGTVYDDEDALTDGVIDGTPISVAVGQLYVNLVKTASNTVVASKALTNGTFSFTTADGIQSGVAYRLVLAPSPAFASSNLPSNVNWLNTGEGISGTAGDGAVDGSFDIASLTNNMVIDFGIEARPIPKLDVVLPSQLNPGGTNNLTIPATAFSAKDTLDLANGEVRYLSFKNFPSNITSITFAAASGTPGGATSTVTYTQSSFPGTGVYVACNLAGNPTSAISVDPVDGAVTVLIIYGAVDQAGVENSINHQGFIHQPLTELSISGTVYDDEDGLTDGNIDGTPISNAGGQLYVNLVRNGVVVASKALTNGTFSFATADGIQAGLAYNVVVAASASSTSASLPDASGWINTGEGISGTSGDGSVNGSFAIASLTNNMVIDFGIEARPVPTPLTTAASQVNPGGTATVAIAQTLFSATDAADLNGGEVRYLHLLTFPTNTTTANFANASTSLHGTYVAASYTAATFPAGGIYVATNLAGNPTAALSVDPIDGAVTIEYSYKAIDQADAESNTTGIVRQPLTELAISGKVFDDEDGLTDGVIDGTPISTASGQLYVNLVNTATNTVVASKILANGAFSFGTADGLQAGVTTYKLILAASATATSAGLPNATDWLNTGDGASGTAGDGTVDGSFTFGAAVVNGQAVDFGIEARPVPVTLLTGTPIQNPGGTNSFNFNLTLFGASDPADLNNTGAVRYLHITGFPEATTSVTFTSASTSLHGTYGSLSYTIANFPANGVYVACNAAGQPIDPIAVDPINGEVSVVFDYKTIDQADVESLNSGTAVQPLTELTISGTVYDDEDGLTDGNIDGTPISNAGGQLYVNLVRNGVVVASKALTNGTFSFATTDGLEAGAAYSVVVTTSASATGAALPNASAWINTGEGISGTSGDGSVNGSFAIASLTNNMVIDFGIEARPVPTPLTTAASQVNPGGTATVAIAQTLFSATDAADLNGGEVRYLHLLTFPTNTTTANFASASTSLHGTYAAASYTAATFPAGGIYVATNLAGNPTAALSVDPIDGAVTIEYSYKAIDQANVESNTAGIARQPLTELAISGKVYDDANALTNNLIDGTLISNAGGQLYVNLVNTATNTVVASKAVTGGAFSFTTADGLQEGVATYKLVLAASATATSAGLPNSSVWVNTGEGTSNTAGDGTVNGTFTFGAAVVNGQAIDFGIEARPVPNPLAVAPAQQNPGGTGTVVMASTLFSATDPVDLNGGEVRFLHILSFPTATTTVFFANAATTLHGASGAVSYTAATFPINGVYVAVDASGNPIDAISVDPINGAVTVNFTYTAIDQADVESLTVGIARQPLTDLAISGNVYDDVTALTDGVIDGSLISNAGGQLYVNLVNTANNTVVASKQLTDGTFAFTTADGLQAGVATYKLVLASSATATSAALPDAAGWLNTGEGTSGTSGDGTVNGTFTFGAAVVNGQVIDFGIEARPVTVALNTAATQINPGGTSTVAIAPSLFGASDPADLHSEGEVRFLHITGFPTNTTSVTFAAASTTPGGAAASVTYTAASFPAGGVYVAANTSGNPTSAISVDPVDGAVTVDIPYKSIDQANVESNTAGIARQPLTELAISGKVYDDANALTNNLIDGTLISNAGGQLYVNLVNTATNTVVASKAVTAGAFSFGTANGLQAGVTTYKLVLAASATATSAGLPNATDWLNTGEGASGTAGDGVVDGSFTFGAAVVNGQAIDFGIEARPVPTALTTAPSQVNPGGTNAVAIASTLFSGTDTRDIAGGEVRFIHIVSFPTNTTSVTFASAATTVGGTASNVTYTAANFPAGGVYVATNLSGNPASAITVDPVDGAVNIDFTYKTVDQANVESNTTGIARQPLTELAISGTVYDDANALTDTLINGTPISNAGGQLYVNLVNTANNTVVASKTLTNGTFAFTTADGLQAGIATYKLVLAASATATSASLPDAAEWLNTGDGASGTSGDGTVNGTFTFGAAVVNGQAIDFGIEVRPNPTLLTTAPAQQNPGGTATVSIASTQFSANDAADLAAAGEVRYIHILSFPTNTTTVNFGSASTSLGGAAAAHSYSAASFPAGGVYIATNLSGNPASSISVDPVDGAVTVEFQYKAIDQANAESNTTGITRQPLTELAISGKVYDDVNALTDGVINGTLISNAGGQLYVNLVNTATNTVVASKAVTGGAFSFTTADGLQAGVTTYKLVLAASATATSAGMPNATAWVNTAEGTSGTAGDGTVDGAFTFGAAVTNGQAIDFGIEARPVPTALTTAPSQVNPGGTNAVTIASTLFSANDAVDIANGEVRFIHIMSFPTNTTSVTFAAAATTVGGTPASVTYTAANFPAGGVYVATNTSGNPTSAITVDPVDGTINVDFTYKAVDQANVESNTTGIARQPLTELAISGKVYDDADALTNNLIDGTLISNAGGQLYVNLVNTATNTVVASKAVTAGAFSFGTADGLQAGVSTYKLVLAASATATSAGLPNAGDWVNTAEGTSGTAGDGTVNGTFTFGAAVVNGQAIDFGIEARPVPAALTTAPSQVNPGGTNAVAIASTLFSGTDTRDIAGGEVRFIHIMSFPTNTTSVSFAAASATAGGTTSAVTYTSANFPAGGVYVATNTSGNPTSAITVDPVDGAVNVDFAYKAVDQAKVESNTTGIARQPLTELAISGTVYDDANALTDALINGTPISNAGGQLYVNLVNTANNTVVASKTLTNGTFAFTTADGLRADISTYRIVLTNGNAAVAAALPNGADWIYTGEGIGGTAGDGTVNGTFTFGAVVTNGQVIDFGIEARPVPTALTTAPSQVNPGGTAAVAIASTLFSATDATDIAGGEVRFIHITAFPTNTTSVTFAAAATTAGGTTSNVTYTAANFPAGGVYVATNLSGNPTSAITVDPVDGAVNVDFSYKAVDQAKVESNNAGIARQPLTELSISGKVYDDVDAGIINGTLISNAGGQLYVNLVNTATNTVVASKAVTGGAFSFTTADGLQAAVATYKLVLASSATVTSAGLPNATDWVNTAEGASGTSGDGAVNGTFVFGAAVTNGQAIDFGIEARPVPATLTVAPSQVNPGGTNNVTIPATTFSANDATDIANGEVRFIHVTGFPTNATSVTFAAASSTPGGATSTVTYTAANFPANGVYVATNLSGNPTTAITVDPVDGAVNVDIPYKAVDQAGVESNTTGIARQPLTELAISGKVYDDVDAGVINGTLISNAGGQLYVNLVNTATNTVVASKAVTSGAFSFTTADGLQAGVATYKLILAASATATSAGLPNATAWVNTAEGTSGTAGDGTVDGTFTFGAAVVNGQAIDFGIDARPVPAALTTAPSQVNPGGTSTVTIPAATFSANDATDIANGEVRFIHITGFPTNTTSVTFAAASSTPGGATSTVTYTAANFPANGVYIATNLSGNPTSAITVDPVDGAVNVDFTYKAVDQAKVESNTTGIARQPLTELSISGTVYDDVDGGVINGTPISVAGGQLYVNLVNTATNTVVASKQLTNGTFSFTTADGLQAGVTTYRLILTNGGGALTAALPNATAWVNTAEGTSGTAGDGTVDGAFTFGGAVTNGQVIDFGIDARPVPVTLTTAPSQVNPGGTATVTIPATTFSANDAVDVANGQVRFIHIVSFPTNTTSVTFAAAAATAGGTTSTVTYTAANFPAGGVYIATNTSGNPTSAITVDPIDGAVNVDFTYKAVDQAKVESNTTGIARQPLTELAISGKVYDDVDGGVINGTLISNAGGQLYVNLVSTATNTVVASKAVTGGAFSFTTADGLQAGVATYKLVLAASATSTSAGLPNASAWVNTAEGTSGTAGDGTVDGTFTFGVAVVNGQTIDFGIDARPVPAALTTAPSQVNPGGTSTVTIPAATFSANDATDIANGEVRFIHVTSFPSNTTSITFAAASSTPGGATSTVTYTAANFPTNGVYIATNLSGNPTTAITVDPVDGAVNVDIPYKAVDQANVESNTTGIARQPLTELAISGKVYDDVDGLTDNLIDGTLISNAGGQLYVNLVNTATSTVVASKAVTGGAFSFTTADGLQAAVTTYKLVLTSSATATSAGLPNATAWVNIAEGTSGTSGDGTVDGAFTFGAAVTNGQAIDFGIDARPVPTTLTTAPSQVNPGGTINVTIPAATFSGNDNTDISGGEVRFIHIMSFPTNATTVTFAAASSTPGGATSTVTYTSANFPAGGVYIATNTSGNPTSAIQVDPVNGVVNVDFTYKTVDQAKVESNTTGIARQPLTCAAPTMTCPSNMTVSNTTGQCGANVTLSTPAGSSSCGTVTVTGARSDSKALTAQFPIGTTTVTWTGTDANGLTVSCQQTVTVNDTQAPTITCPANITVNNTTNMCGAVLSIAKATATDNCGNPTVTGTRGDKMDLTDPFPVGNTDIIWAAVDAAGNATTCVQTVTVVDNQKPVITCSANATVNAAAGQCSATVTVTQPTATDNCSVSSITGVRSDNQALTAAYPVGTTTITWTAKDASNNTQTCTQTVTVRDVTAPVITCPANMTNVSTSAGACTATITVTPATATDQCGSVTVSGVRSDAQALTAVYPKGTTTITWTATDASGNTSTCTQTITVVDGTLPTLTTPSPIAACDNGSGNNKTLTATAADNCGVSTITWAMTGATTGTGSGATVTSNFNIGVTTITWTVKDAAGNTKTGSITVTIYAPPTPVITQTSQDQLCNQTVLTASGGTSYQWINGGSTVGTGQTLTLPLANCSGTINFAPTTAAQKFNVFVQGGVTASAGDTHGPVAMGGDLTLNGQTIFVMNTNGFYPSGTQDNSANYGMVIGGRVYYSGGNQSTVNQGYLRIGNTTGSQIWYTDNNNAATNLKLTATGAGFNGNPSLMLQRQQASGTATQSSGLDFSTAFSTFSTEATRINSWSSSSETFLNKITVATGSNPHITLVDNKINYINLTATQLNNWNNQGSIIFDNKPTASRPLVINVTLTNAFTWNVANIGGLDENNSAYIIWNFNGGGSLTVGGSNPVFGTVFAPLSTVDKVNNNNLNGQIIGQSLKVGSGEIHYYPFNTTLGYPGCSNQFQLYVTDANGCKSTTAASYTYTAPANTDRYTIVGLDAVTLADNNFVQTGSVGVNNTGGAATVQGTSTINGTGAFLKAPSMTVSASSDVPTRVTAPAGYVLPTMPSFLSTYSTTNLTVPANTTATYSPSYGTVYISKGAKVTLNGTAFKSVTIEEGGMVTFTAASIDMQTLTVGNGLGTAAASAMANFAAGSSVRISSQMNVGLKSVVNSLNYRVTFYLGSDAVADKVVVKGGGSTVNGVIYAPTGNIKVGTDVGLRTTLPATATNCSQTNGRITTEYQGYTQNSNGTYTLKFKVTNTGTTDISHVAFELPSGTCSSYSNSNTNFHYNMENGTTNPFPCVKFEATCDGLSNGETDTYTYTMTAAQFNALSTVRVQVKYGTTIFAPTYNREGCGSTTTTATCTASYMNGLFIGKTVMSEKCVYWNSVSCGTTTARTTPAYVSNDAPVRNINALTIEEAEVKTIPVVKAYPNPNNGTFNVEVRGAGTGVARIQVVSSAGAVVLTRQLTLNGKSDIVPLQLPSVTAGLYTINVIGQSATLTTRVMVAH